jgi:hypothetical protein
LYNFINIFNILINYLSIIENLINTSFKSISYFIQFLLKYIKIEYLKLKDLETSEKKTINLSENVLFILNYLNFFITKFFLNLFCMERINSFKYNIFTIIGYKTYLCIHYLIFVFNFLYTKLKQK